MLFRPLRVSQGFRDRKILEYTQKHHLPVPQSQQAQQEMDHAEALPRHRPLTAGLQGRGEVDPEDYGAGA